MAAKAITVLLLRIKYIMRSNDLAAFKSILSDFDKWIHLAILLGEIAKDHGADPRQIDCLLLKTDKSNIDKLLAERLET